ncbi:DUF3995 domain-containing protein [Saccharothrix yanglingensis]|uniref:DUF3995 domain-containing protein n=1 Tax=Saccharothrix yanglingensis TaxID=659496 RepID=A0ABU0WZE8_9PSEU|nr:DUF3995 domain-containing protein [Saccharothrix yanglingensis]MDQ2585251.1 hypothetical protein [Saccharothrix yanglingensis]
MIVLAVLTAAVLVLIGALHVLWMFSPWPLRTREEFARRVVDVPVDKLPTPGVTLVVAVLLVVAGYLVAARAELVAVPGPRWLPAAGAAGVAVVFLLRGTAGLLVSSRRTTEFARLDRRYYSPLCLGLAASCAVLALTHPAA